MPDITMCEGSSLITNGRLKPGEIDEAPVVTECPMKETCYRFKAKPSDFRQAYFRGIPYDPDTGECGGFMLLYKKDAVEAPGGLVADNDAKGPSHDG